MRKVLAAIGMASVVLSSSADTITKPLDLNFRLDGKSMGERSAEWWQWAMASTDDANPVSDTSGEHCSTGQEGKVWFLAGGFGSSKISRSCRIPNDKYLFFPIINMAYWPEKARNGYSCEHAQRSAAVNNDSALELFLEIDGQAIENPRHYRVRTSACFDVYERVPSERKAYRAYPAASDGYWIMLPPLARGRHTLKFGGRYNSKFDPFGKMVQDIEYQILVQ